MLREHDFEGDLPAELGIFRLVDEPHAAAAQDREDAVGPEPAELARLLGGAQEAVVVRRPHGAERGRGNTQRRVVGVAALRERLAFDGPGRRRLESVHRGRQGR